MTTKLLFIAPYQSMQLVIEQCAAEDREIDAEIKIANLQEGLKIAKEYEKNGGGIVISRGGTARLIEKETSIPVIEIPISGYDLLRAVTLANDFQGKKAIVGFSNITTGAKAVLDLLDLAIDLFTVTEEDEVMPLVRQLKRDGYELVIGDVVTVTSSQALGLQNILIQSGREAVLEAMHRAKSISGFISKKLMQQSMMNQIVETSSVDFFVVNDQGKVIYEKWKQMKKNPLSELDMMTLPSREDVRKDGSLRIFSASEGRFKLKISPFLSLNGDGIFCEASRLYDKYSAGAAYEESIQPPVLIHKSGKMNELVQTIKNEQHFPIVALYGQRGTGKKTAAAYYHYLKYRDSGLFASLSLEDFLYNPAASLDRDAKTVYIHTLFDCFEEEQNILREKIQYLTEAGITVMLSFSRKLEGIEAQLAAFSVLHIELPLLKDRKEDIKELALYFLAEFHQQHGTSPIKWDKKAQELFLEQPWPGNVAELKEAVKTLAQEEKGSILKEHSVRSYFDRLAPAAAFPPDFFTGTLEEIEAKVIERVLQEENLNQTKTAKRLGITRATLWRKLKR